jgi:hypothetical protein
MAKQIKTQPLGEAYQPGYSGRFYRRHGKSGTAEC